MGRLESINVSRGGVPKARVPEAVVTETGVIAGSFAGGDFARLSHKRHPGWSRVCARVIRGGAIRAGDKVEIVPSRPG